MCILEDAGGNPWLPKMQKKKSRWIQDPIFFGYKQTMTYLKTDPHLQSKNCQVIQRESFKIF